MQRCKEWEDALRKVIEDSEYRKKIVENAYLKCKENYTTFRTGLRLAKLYEEEKKYELCIRTAGIRNQRWYQSCITTCGDAAKKGNEVSIFTLDSNEKMV